MGSHRESGEPTETPATSRWISRNLTESDYPQQSLAELFEATVAANPDAVAAIHGARVVTYGTLNESANRLARHLIGLGVGAEVPVGVALDSSIQRAVGILAILKAGGAYLPLDPEYPETRLLGMVQDTNVSLVLTEDRLVPRLPADGVDIVCIDTDAGHFSHLPGSNPESRVDPENLAYIIFTSGSTGKPKGIAIRHSGIVNNLVDLIGRFDVCPEDRVLAISSLTFDMCVFEVLGTLLAGAAIVFPDASRAKDPAHWAELVDANAVSVWNSAPALLEMFATYLEATPDMRPASLRLALLGGDWIPVSLPDRIRTLIPALLFVSLGGATESSIHSTIYPVGDVDPSWPSIPYGHPMANQQTYVLDDEFRLVGDGAAGELYIGGAGLARGYYGQPAMTAERFIPDAHSGRPGARLYRTGDLVRHLADGNLELLGRVDLQVKIRGHRVELREIESHLLADPRVADAVVIGHRDGTGGARLIAYVLLSTDDADGETSEIARAEVDTVSRWETVYEQAYAAGDVRADGRDFAGWVSSFDGLPFTDEELAELFDRTVADILELDPRRVLEIGCGTGLVLFDVAPHCERYDATDISAAAVEAVRARVAREELASVAIDVARRPAHDFAGVDESGYDTVIINSVTQHFPTVSYLARVLNGAARALGSDGRIFIGDVRNLSLLRAFHTAIELRRSPGSRSLADLVQGVDWRVEHEKELWVDPRFFAEWCRTVAGQPTAEVRVRTSSYDNEMALFHYDVVITFGGSQARGRAAAPVASFSSLTEFREHLASAPPGSSMRLMDVPDARLAESLASVRCCGDLPEAASVSDLRRAAAAAATAESIDPSEFWALAEQQSADVTLLWPQSGRAGCYDVILGRGDRDPEGPPAEATDDARVAPTAAEWDGYGTTFSRTRDAGELAGELRSVLSAVLPEFMVPSDFVVVDEFPLSPNGKVDRRALPIPAPSRVRVDAEFQPLGSPLQEVLAGIWSEALQIEGIGADDDFFQLGGHSLTAVQIGSRVSETLALAAPLGMLFDHPRLSSYAEQLRNLADADGIDLDQVAGVVLEVSRLSDEEVSRSLAEPDGGFRS